MQLSLSRRRSTICPSLMVMRYVSVPIGLPVAELTSALTQAVQPDPRGSCSGCDTRTSCGEDVLTNTEFSWSRTNCLTSGDDWGGLSGSWARMNSGTGAWLSARPQAASVSTALPTNPIWTSLHHPMGGLCPTKVATERCRPLFHDKQLLISRSVHQKMERRRLQRFAAVVLRSNFGVYDRRGDDSNEARGDCGGDIGVNGFACTGTGGRRRQAAS